MNDLERFKDETESTFPLPVFDVSKDIEITPVGFELFPPEDRRIVSFEDLDREPRTVGKLPLFATVDFGQPQIEIRYAVVDVLSTGYQRLGLCAINSDGTYDRYSVGGYPLGSRNYSAQVIAGVIVRVGDFVPER